MMIPDMFAALLRHTEVDPRDVADAVRGALALCDGKTSFHSDLVAPSAARCNQPGGVPVALPQALPFIAGTLHGDVLDISAIRIDERLIWYRDGGTRTQLVVRKLGGKLPTSVIIGLAGRKVRDVVDHPMIRDIDPTIVKAHGNAATLHLVVASGWCEAE